MVTPQSQGQSHIDVAVDDLPPLENVKGVGELGQ